MPNKRLVLQIDFRSGLPIYTQIVNQIQARVAAGQLQPGDQLPTVRQLAADLRVNFNTVARAYRLLDEEGIISTQHGRGTYILDRLSPKDGEKMRRKQLVLLAEHFVTEAEKLGFTPAEVRKLVDEQIKSWQQEQRRKAKE